MTAWTQRLVIAAAVAMVCTTGCKDRRAPRGKDWRSEIPFRYPVAMDKRIVIPGQRVWGANAAEMELLLATSGTSGSPEDRSASTGGAGATVRMTLVPDHPCALGPVRRFVLEAGPALHEHQIARVVCREHGAAPDAPAPTVEVVPYLERVARALGYSFEVWLKKGFVFQGEVTRPEYTTRTFRDRWEFLDYTMSSNWRRELQFGPMVPELATRRNRTVLVVSFGDCELRGWQSAWFENNLSRGQDLIYHWVMGGGRFAVCDGPDNRYLLGMPRTLKEIGLDGVKAFFECVRAMPLDTQDVDIRCN